MPSRQLSSPAAPGGDASRVEPIFAASPFGGLTGASRREVLEAFSPLRLPRRHVVVRPAATAPRLLLIGAGRVRVERRGAEARSVPLGHRGPGETVGEASLVAGRPVLESAHVVDEGDALAAPAGRLRAIADARPDVRAAVLDLLLAVRRAAEARLLVLLQCDVRARLAHVVLEALARWGAPHPAGEVVTAPFTHADLAALVGSTRETTTIVLSRMRAEGLIGLDRRRIVVPSRAALSACVAAA